MYAWLKIKFAGKFGIPIDKIFTEVRGQSLSCIFSRESKSDFENNCRQQDTK